MLYEKFLSQGRGLRGSYKIKNYDFFFSYYTLNRYALKFCSMLFELLFGLYICFLLDILNGFYFVCSDCRWLFVVLLLEVTIEKAIIGGGILPRQGGFLC